MDKVETYRQYVQQLLKNKAQNSSSSEVEAQLLLDTERDHYQLIYVGWQNQKRIFGPVIHIDIKDGKIWIQWNGTEAYIGQELVQMGVPKEDIVLGFQAEEMRKYTEYAVK